MNMGTWTVQGVGQQVDEDLKKIGLHIIALTKIKKKGTGTHNIGEYTHLQKREKSD